MAKKQRLRVLSIDFDYFQVVDKDTVQSCYPDGIDLDTSLSTVVWASHYAIPSQKEKLDKVFCNQEELRLIRHILMKIVRLLRPYVSPTAMYIFMISSRKIWNLLEQHLWMLQMSTCIMICSTAIRT